MKHRVKQVEAVAGPRIVHGATPRVFPPQETCIFLVRMEGEEEEDQNPDTHVLRHRNRGDELLIRWSFSGGNSSFFERAADGRVLLTITVRKIFFWKVPRVALCCRFRGSPTMATGWYQDVLLTFEITVSFSNYQTFLSKEVCVNLYRVFHLSENAFDLYFSLG